MDESNDPCEQGRSLLGRREHQPKSYRICSSQFPLHCAPGDVEENVLFRYVSTHMVCAHCLTSSRYHSKTYICCTTMKQTHHAAKRAAEDVCTAQGLFSVEGLGTARNGCHALFRPAIICQQMMATHASTHHFTPQLNFKDLGQCTSFR